METMALNITWQGRSGTAYGMIRAGIGHTEIKRIAVELVRTGALNEGPHDPELPTNAFDDFVVDPPADDGIWHLRPKVPFGEKATAVEDLRHLAEVGACTSTPRRLDPEHEWMTLPQAYSVTLVRDPAKRFLVVDLTDVPCTVYASGLHRCECGAVWRATQQQPVSNDSHRRGED